MRVSDLRVTVVAPARVAAQGAAVTVDGVARPDAWIPIVDDGARHEVRVAPTEAGRP